ncbi:MAG: AAA family ATPase [Rectinemataceae bacterium]|jgi:energy-coupling factor transporter ATP-binding protein EcfA2
MGFTSLTIQDFRAFKDLQIDGFGNVNLIVGRNNTGKTSLLEALLLITGMSNPGLPIAIHNWRDLILTEADDFQFMFHNLDFSNIIHITAVQFDGKVRNLKIEPQYGITPGSLIPGSLIPGGFIPGPQGIDQSSETIGGKKSGTHSLASTLSNKNITGIQLSFTTPEGNPLTTYVNIFQGGSVTTAPPVYKDELVGVFLNPRTINLGFEIIWERLLREKKTDFVIKALKQIEPRIQRIDIGTRGMLWVDIGLETLAPINILGDGFRHIFTVLASLYTAQNGVLIIDEIENGLHHSTLEVMWDALLAASQDYNVQVFATTHSYECVVAYADAVEKIYPIAPDSAKLFRLERIPEGGHRAVPYTSKVMRTALDQGYEVR